MDLRLMGSTDLVTRWAAILERLGLPGKVYPLRRGAGSRLYLDVDDRQAEQLAERLEQAVPAAGPSAGAQTRRVKSLTGGHDG